MCWKSDTAYDCGDFGAPIYQPCDFALDSTRADGVPQPLRAGCHDNIHSTGVKKINTPCPKCRYRKSKSLQGVQFTHTPLGGETVPLSRASVASRPGTLPVREKEEWVRTMREELAAKRYKTGDSPVPEDNVGWGRTLKKKDDDTPQLSPLRFASDINLEDLPQCEHS